MRTTDKAEELWRAIAAARKGMGAVKRDAKNPHFRHNYASLESVYRCSEEALDAAGLLVMQCIEETGTDQCLTTRIIHTETAQWVEGSIILRPVKPDPQAMGSAITYARRYSLVTMLGLSMTDDDGNKASEKPEPKVEFGDTPKAQPKRAEPKYDPEAGSKADALVHLAGEAMGRADLEDVRKSAQADGLTGEHMARVLTAVKERIVELQEAVAKKE